MLVLEVSFQLTSIPQPTPRVINLQGVPPLNNDHVLDGAHILLSAYDDWQLYRAPLAAGVAV